MFSGCTGKGHLEHADILIFASTEQEIRELQETLIKHGPRHTEVLPLYARLALAEQQKSLILRAAADALLSPRT